MSTPTNPPASPTLAQIKAHLLEIHPQLFKPASPASVVLPAERTALERINGTLARINETFLTQARRLYQDLDSTDLSQTQGQQLLSRLKTQLNKDLQTLDETSTVERQARKTYLTFDAGITALETETRLNVRDYLLTPAHQKMLEDCSRGPAFRPGQYALTFSYQDQTVTFAGAFVLTRESSPKVIDLTSREEVGAVLLFTPSRGLEAFDTLADLDQALHSMMTLPAGRKEIAAHLPVRYQHMDVADIWPLELQLIEGEPLFDHVYQALLDKRSLDIDLALGTEAPDAAVLKTQLDNAVKAALPDLSPRLEFRAQQLLEHDLYASLPDWYRTASTDRRATLAEHLKAYNEARRDFLNVFGPAATPAALARQQWAEHLANELDIHDLDPDLLHLTTRRTVPLVGTYEHKRTLVDLALRGLHTGDELPGSTFLQHTTLTYNDAPLTAQHAELTPQTVLTLLQDLQPRVEFALTQKPMLGDPHLKQAARAFFDQRLVALAYIASLRGDLTAADHQLFEQLRANTHMHLRAQTVLLHGAQLKDLWVLREETPQGQVKRMLLCTPDAPKAVHFIGFASERECQTHIIGWLDEKSRSDGCTMCDYVLGQVPLRFQPSLQNFVQHLGLKPDAQEHLEVTFGKACTYSDCLDATVTHRLSMLLDDYQHGSPDWYRAASTTDRARLAKLADDAVGAVQIYSAWPDAEAKFPAFKSYLHEKAKLALNKLLDRRQNDVDPDTVFAYSPKPLVGQSAPPMSYTTLYQDGYEDGIGFLTEKFSASATFRGPDDIDLSQLTPQNVARSVTGTWVGERYIEDVRKRLQAEDSPGYAKRRDATLKIQQLQMENAALESRLKGHIASADLTWLQSAIDSLADSSTATRNTYKVHRLFINGDWIIGNYLFSHADEPVLLYTPNAPDGIAFREAKLFNYLLKKVEGFLAYLCKRAPLQSQSRITLFLEEARKGLPEDINRTTPSPARHDPITRATPLTDLRHELYNMVLQRKIDDVRATTVSRAQVISAILWTCIEWVTAVATMPMPSLSLTLGGALAFKDAMLALNAYHQGDTAGALNHYLGYLANIGGALLFDFRPALASATKKLRPVIKTGEQATQRAVVEQLDSLAPEAMQPVLYDGQALWAPETPDALGRYLLYRKDPLTGQLHSTARLANRNVDGQWVRSGMAGGAPKYEPLKPEDTALAAYDMPPDQGKNFGALLYPDFTALQRDWDVDIAGAARHNAYIQSAPLRELYDDRVQKLTGAAEQFFKALPAPAPKTELPALATDTSHADLLKTLFGRDKRLIIGAPNRAIANKQLLIEHMPDLAAQGLKRIYIENLPRDLFHRKLKILGNQLKGDKPWSLKILEYHLAQVDQDLGLAKDAPFTYRKLLLAAQRHNVLIDGLDTAASYHMEHVLALGEGPRFVARSSKLRNFYSHKAIEQNLANDPDEGWIALVDSNRLGTYEQIRGLADLQNAPSLRIEEVAPGQPVGVWPDTTTAAQSKGDYRLAVTADKAAAQASGPSSAAVPTSVTHYDAFDIPQNIREDITYMASSRKGLDRHYGFAKPHHAQADAIFRNVQARLRDSAKSFFTDFKMAPRSSLDTLASAGSEKAFIEQLFKHKNGLVIGEAHSAQSSKAFLIDHMKALKKQGVKTLYMEHLLTDMHQEALDTFYATSKMSPALKNYLATQDYGHMPGYKGPHTYTKVVKVANKQGIRVRALDCTASYHVKGFDEKVRYEMFSYFANEVIKADQVATGPHKWIAFMGSTHTDLHQGVPGLVDLQDAVSLHVRDTFPAQASPLKVGGWQSAKRGIMGGEVALRSDFVLNVGIPGWRVAVDINPPTRAKLKRPGEYFIERTGDGEVNLVHRSRSQEIVTTPISIDDSGRYHIDRWDAVKGKRFYDLEKMLDALQQPDPDGAGLTRLT
ncbi:MULTISPECIES: membrane-targeted effector domain-containing toxin [Pseudomonas]|uniref:Membrane-targeted effector domain-containing toxin n=1 Tax=Pseudomonas azadiae TaxID=2843612 RepID=A0ABS6NWK9_9PSED|nr:MULTISPECIES: membrane-targeted effector domain-containing toxin [Pseudomonas]MBV4452609.1 membrane-targeted effector domain-containing toxin [Pseudomonas azadiae]NMF38997.1 membrane-targeted effector domain-containing toxin [Pseudomonas sp. SWRI 103]